MKIGINCFMLQKHMGGLRQYFFTLMDELLSTTDHTFILFYFDRNVSELSNLRYERWKDDAILLNDQTQITGYLQDCDLYFCPFGALWPTPLPVPSVVTLADIQEKFYPQFFRMADLYNRDLYFLGSTKMADRVIAISEFTRQTILRYHHVPAEKVKRVYLSLDSLFCQADRLARKPAVDLPERFVFYPANPWFHKNHDNLLRSLKLLKEQGLVIPAVLTGHDQEAGYPLRDKLAEYELEFQVLYLNYVSIEEIMYLHRHAEMLVFPSLFEGFGIPVIEAMASGCPVVISNTTSLPELGKDAAEYFNPQDPVSIARAIQKVWLDVDLRHRMIARGRSLAGEFSPQKMAADHLAVFEEAKDAFRMWRYWWNERIYNPYHKARVNAKWALKAGPRRTIKKVLKRPGGE